MVGAGGRFVFSKKAGEALAGCSHVRFDWDPEDRQIIFSGLKAVPKGKEDTAIALVVPKEGAKGSRNISLAGAGILNWLRAGCPVDGKAMAPKLGYSYKDAGNQTFDATVNPKLLQVSIELPETTPAKRDVKPRAKKGAKAPALVAPEAPAVEGEFEAA
jgi:hypothetical protein